LNLIDTLQQRGFVEKTTNDNEIKGCLDKGAVTGYIGFDPTASSLHVGNLVQIMTLSQMQRHGHRPIALVGGGTGLVGDPSGKTEMRQMLSEEDIQRNRLSLEKQIGRFVQLDSEKGLLLDNSQWLKPLNYISFLREVGRHFSVNRMLSFESYKIRLEKGLSFLEFNYQLLQAYDFLVLFKEHGYVGLVDFDDSFQ